MKTTFIPCTASETSEVTHVICVTQPAIYSLPDFNLVSGCNDSTLRESALKWFENGCKPEVKTVQSQPPGFQEALKMVREHRDQVNIAELAEAVGISEKFLTLCIDDIKWKGAVSRIPMANRQNFIDAVAKLEFSPNPSEIPEYVIFLSKKSYVLNRWTLVDKNNKQKRLIASLIAISLFAMYPKPDSNFCNPQLTFQTVDFIKKW